MERERELVLVIDEHALGHEEVEVHVEVSGLQRQTGLLERTMIAWPGPATGAGQANSSTCARLPGAAASWRSQVTSGARKLSASAMYAAS